MRVIQQLAARLFLVLSPVIVFSQTLSTGRIRGTIRDAQGALIAGAEIEIQNPSTAAIPFAWCNPRRQAHGQGHRSEQFWSAHRIGMVAFEFWPVGVSCRLWRLLSAPIVHLSRA
jgi:hypothetical protein